MDGLRLRTKWDIGRVRRWLDIGARGHGMWPIFFVPERAWCGLWAFWVLVLDLKKGEEADPVKPSPCHLVEGLFHKRLGKLTQDKGSCTSFQMVGKVK